MANDKPVVIINGDFNEVPNTDNIIIPAVIFIGTATATDAAIGRTSQGALEINSGTIGQWGDFTAGLATINALTDPVTITATKTGTGTGTSWEYTVVAVLADGTTITGGINNSGFVSGNATLDGTHFWTITWSAVTGASFYNIYRSFAGGTPNTTGLLAQQLASSPLSFVDNGVAIINASAPSGVNGTGIITVGGNATVGGTLGVSGTTTVVALIATGTFTSHQITPSVVNTYDLGSSSVPFRNVYVGTSSTNRTQITTNNTANRTLTLPDANTTTVQPKASATSSQWLTNIPSTGVQTTSQPNYTDLAGVLPNPSSSTLGGIQSIAATTSQWINTISTSGVPSKSQPAFTDISGTCATSQGGTGRNNFINALFIFGGPATPGGAAAAPAFNSYDSAAIFGGASNARTLPTTGTITGEYWHSGNWTQTGTITSNRARIHISGTMTINGSWVVATECTGGAQGPASATATTAIAGSYGAGLAGGSPGPSQALAQAGGGGGGHGGAGGAGGTAANTIPGAIGGQTYPLESLLTGSGGGAGTSGAANQGGGGGAGGGSLYIEATGNISCTSSCAMTATGAAGSAAAGASASSGGGGSGGGICIRSLGTFTLSASGTITATGGAGGNATTSGAAGGGGGGGIIDISSSTTTNSGTITAGGGAAGTGGTVTASAGSAGTVTTNSFIQLVRSSN